MKINFTGASLAIAGIGLLTAAGLRRKSGGLNIDSEVIEAMEGFGFPRIQLVDREGWLLRQNGSRQAILTREADEWIVATRDSRRPAELTSEWRGTEGAQAVREAMRIAGVHQFKPRPSEAARAAPAGGDEEGRLRTWSMTFDQREDALRAWREDQELARSISDSSAEHLRAHVEKRDDGWAYVYRAVNPHEGSVLVLHDEDGSSNRKMERKKIRQAEKAYGVMPFNDWVKAVSEIRGASLTQADPYRPAIEASQGETWYDVWLEGMKPQEAAKLGSRSLR